MIPYLPQGYRAATDPEREMPPAFLLQVRDPKNLSKEARWTIAEDNGAYHSGAEIDR